MEGGLYELTYIPASRGAFLLHVVCLREAEGGEADETEQPQGAPLMLHEATFRDRLRRRHGDYY